MEKKALGYSISMPFRLYFKGFRAKASYLGTPD